MHEIVELAPNYLALADEFMSSGKTDTDALMAFVVDKGLSYDSEKMAEFETALLSRGYKGLDSTFGNGRKLHLKIEDLINTQRDVALLVLDGVLHA